jgi:hypothetical protein
MFDINLIEWVGYGASVLVAVSLLMSSIIRLRWYNTAGSILFSIYGYVIGALPVAIINSFIIIINIYYLYRLYSEKENFRIMEISKDDSYLISFFSYYKDDIKKLFPDFQDRLQESRKVQLDSWSEIIHAAREKGEIESPMSDEQIANMFINTSGGVEMNSIFKGSSEDVGKTLLSLWGSFYEELKA